MQRTKNLSNLDSKIFQRGIFSPTFVKG